MNLLKFIPLLLLCAMPVTKATAQDPITEIIRQGVIKVIKAVDLRIQRLQNQTIWLQNAQKAIENTLSQLKLDEISDWVERQRLLYQDYFAELASVKAVIAYYHRIRDITDNQVRLVREYKRAFGLIQGDKHFTMSELFYIGQVYNGILEKSTENLDRLFLVLESFTTSMTDASRLEILQAVWDDMERYLIDLRLFNQQNALLRIQRATDLKEVQVLKTLYGLP